jgi:hypothetical protein
MENLWNKAHMFVINSKVGDFYYSGQNKIVVTKRTPRRIYFSNGKIITIQKSNSKEFLFFNGKHVNQILRDIEGYFLYLIHYPKF